MNTAEPDPAGPDEDIDTARVRLATAYLDALLSHDARHVRFHPEAVRYEVGIKTGYSGKHLTASLNKGWQYRLVRTVHPPQWTVQADTVTARYRLDAGLAGFTLATRIVEVFRIPRDDLRIHRIDARIRVARRHQHPDT